MADTHTPKVKLDWSRLLVFDQAQLNSADAKESGRLHDPRLGKIGMKPVLGQGPRYIPWRDPALHECAAPRFSPAGLAL